MVKTIGSSSAFDEAYKTLNKSQKEAVDTIEGPVMVVAGPGTGKTQILTLRIANILLKTDASPDSILALTFTESGAKAMRDRLRKYIGATAYQVPIYTFHGFSQTLISAYPDAYTRVIGGRPAGDLEKIMLIESIVNDGQIKVLRPMGNPSYYITHILRIIGQLKQEYVTSEALIEIVKKQEEELMGVEQYHTKGAHKGKVKGDYKKLEKTITKNRELIYVYQRYEALLSENNLYDFEDMIVETVQALQKDEDMLRDLQERYQYILADEHQDVNGSQNKILELLSSFHQSPNIFAVGDEKQAIYRFQGASLENFLYFTEQFRDSKVVALTDNYRSGQSILDAAHSLVAVEDGPLKELRLPLEAKAVDASAFTKRQFSHQSVEDTWVVEAAKAEIAGGLLPSEIVVIVRTNREVESFAAAFRKAGVPVTASADGDVLRHSITQAVRGLIDAVITNKSEIALFTVLHGAYWNIQPDDLVKVLSGRSYNRSLWSILSDKKELETLKVSEPDKFLKVSEIIVEARSLEVHEAPHRVLEMLLQRSGFLSHLIEHDAFEGTRVVRRLYDEIEELVVRDGVGSLREVSEIFITRLDYNLPLNAPYISTNTESVQVMTAHKSKGLEFQVVFVPHLNDNGWGGSAKKKYFDVPLASHGEIVDTDLVEDERRLLYVAMTRAKTTLNLSASDINAEGRELSPARLGDEISDEFVEECSTLEDENKFSAVASLMEPLTPIAISSDLLKNLLEERGFSATSLNNYLRSPWDYLYRNVLRVPEAQPAHMLYGTAVHNTLEYMTRGSTKTGTLPDVSAMKKKLEEELNRLPINTDEYVRLLEKGLEELVVYREHLSTTVSKNTKEELGLKVFIKTGVPELPELLLTGKIDRIDLNEEGYSVRVVDYKTGKPKSRNVIEGNTKDSDGGYKRQLVFYALLLKSYDDDRYKCNEGVLSFVQSDAKGDIREETFTITDEEIEDLRLEIIESVKQIVSGDFLKSDCDESVSDYCGFVKLLKEKL